MNDTNRQTVNEETARRGVLDHLKSTLQAQVDSKFEIEAIVDLTPLMTEVMLRDKTAGSRFLARIYRLSDQDAPLARELWEKHGGALKGIAGSLPVRIHGLQKLGNVYAHVAAAPTGMDLNTYLRQVGLCRPEFALRTITQLLLQLEGPAAKGVHHLQIKPTDVALTREGGVVLKNMGLSAFENELAARMHLDDLSNAAYAAPEQLKGGQTGVATDIYRLGVLFFRMMTGRLPFSGTYEQTRKGHLHDPMPNPQAFNKQVGVGIARVLMKSMAKEPAQRFQSLAEFKTALSMLHPASERAVLAGAPSKPLSEKDMERIQEQLTEARDLCTNKDYQTALRTVDSVLMVSGPHEGAVKLYNQISDIMNAGPVQKSLKEANERLGKRQVAGTLQALNKVLALQPGNQQALKMQARIFEGVKQRLLDHQPACPIDPMLGRAAEAKSEANIMLAEGLWSMIMLAPAGANDEETKKKMQFGRQLAARGLKGMHGMAQSAPSPAAQSPEPAPVPPPPVPEPVAQTPPPAPEPVAQTPPPSPAVPPEEMDPLQRAMMEADKKDPPVSKPPGEDQALSGGENFFDDPPEAPATEPSSTIDNMMDEEEENFFDDPPDTPPVAVATKKAKKSIPPKMLMIAAAVVVVIISVAILLVIRANQQKQYRLAGMGAFEKVIQLEQSGDWDGALAQWDQVNTDFPGFEYGPEKDTADARIAALQKRITERKRDIEDLIGRAEGYVNQDLLVGETEMNALYNINRVRALDPDHADLTALIARIRTEQSTKATLLVDQDKILEAKLVYDRLRLIDDTYRDEVLEERMREWLTEKVVKPEMAKIERAAKRKKWADALELSEALRPKMPDAAPLDEFWENVMVDYQALYTQALANGKETNMLKALEVMALIRPDDQELMDRKDRLSRNINLTKITNLEREISQHMKNKQYLRAARSAKNLQAVESKNKVANGALEEIRFRKKEDIKQVENNNPREAVALYADLLKVSNWKSYRKERDALKERVTAFDARVDGLKSKTRQPLDQQRQAVDKILEDFPTFVNDPKYTQLTTLSKQLAAEHTKLNDILSWESRAAKDPGKPYADILNRLKKETGFTFNYARTRISGLTKKYTDKIKNYDGNVTLVIKTGQNLPTIKARKPRGFCTLDVAGKSYKTEQTLLTSPSWNYIATFQAEPGKKLVFKVFQTLRREEKLLGTIELDAVPQSKKNMVLTSANGNWSLVVDVRRER